MGTVHRSYGGLPNMSWVLGRGGVILYKAMWTSAACIGRFLTRYAAQPLDMAHAPFYSEQLEVRHRDSQAFAEGLERNGARAVAEFARAEEIWTARGRAARSARA